MKVLLIGTGGVRKAIAVVAKHRPWLEKIVLADYDLKRAVSVQKRLGDKNKFPVEKIECKIREEESEYTKSR